VGANESDWRQTFDSMVKLPDDRAKIIAAYLGKNFPSVRIGRRPSSCQAI